MDKTEPKLAIVIPSLDGNRNGAVPRLLASIEAQTYQNHDVELVTGVSPQGLAINQGVSRTSGDIIVILDDDAELAESTVLQALVDTLESDPKIGMAGASIDLAPDANRFQRKAAAQYPRWRTPVVESVTDSDFACHGCCAIPRKIFEEIGGERTSIIRGLDPDLRQRLRATGYRVVLAPNARIFHPPPATWRALLRMSFRNGKGSAYAQKYFPDQVFETDERLNSDEFRVRRSHAYRVLRFPGRLLRAIVTGQTLRFAGYSFYAIGYVWGWLTASPLPTTEAGSASE